MSKVIASVMIAAGLLSLPVEARVHYSSDSRRTNDPMWSHILNQIGEIKRECVAMAENDAAGEEASMRFLTSQYERMKAQEQIDKTLRARRQDCLDKQQRNLKRAKELIGQKIWQDLLGEMEQ